MPSSNAFKDKAQKEQSENLKTLKSSLVKTMDKLGF